jgi:TolB-like protein/DNA-binding winged helix-turn-helix (wHTH) protein
MTSAMSKDHSILRIGAWRVHAALDEISKDGNTVKLERRMMQLLMCLAEHSGQVVSVEQLLDEVWAGVVVAPGSVYQTVASLRRLLGDDTKEPTYIANVPRRGYRLVAPVTAWVDAPQLTPEQSPRPAAEPDRAAAVARRGAIGRRGAVVVCIVLLAGLSYVAADKFWMSKPVPARAASDKSIAVLPFVDMSEKRDQEYFSDGLSDELIESLAQVPELQVPARTSSFYFKGKSATIQEIAKALHVTHLLEGSVRKSGNTIRVTAELVRADNGYHLWSETYDRDIKDIFKVQDEIAAAVVTALKATLALSAKVSSRRTSSADAYNQFLLGRQFYNRSNADGFTRAVAAYRQAIALDPSYAAAYAGLADAEDNLADWTGDTSGLKRAEAAAEKAIALAPDEADGYAARGSQRIYHSWDWTGARADFTKALTLNPSDSLLLRAYGIMLGYLGQLPEAMIAIRKSIAIDPLSSRGWEALGTFLLAQKDFPATHEALRRALEIQPDDALSLNRLAVLQLLEGKAADALSTYRNIDDDGFRLYGIAMTEHTLGHSKASQQALDEAIAKHAQDSAYQIAEAHAWRGEKDDAFDWLERAYRQRDGGLAETKIDPLLENLHGDPHYQAMLRKLNLPE